MKKRNILTAAFAGLLVASTAGSALGQAPGQAPGEDTLGTVTSEAEFDSPSLFPIVTETGQISLSVDALGTLADRGLVQVDKPANATVRRAFLAAASTGFSSFEIPDNTMLLNGEPIAWDMVIPTSMHQPPRNPSWNHWAEVTDIVKDTIDAAPPGIVDLEIVEGDDTLDIDGSILAVIFDNKKEPQLNNTVVLFFGAQNVDGDDFTINLAEPIYPADPALVFDLSLGISFGFQFTYPFQTNEIDVNGSRLADYAGGQDDGEDGNGALITVGGVGDTNANPPLVGDLTEVPPPTLDDELYNLIPFVNDGDTSIFVETWNQSTDDNIYFGAVFLAASHKVEICHIPRAKPDNFHTITVSKKALQAHLAHGDLLGACGGSCEDLCDDGDTCTVDDCDDRGCVDPPLPVDCNDDIDCTNDSCDSASGCVYEDACLPDEVCNPTTGACDVVAKLVFVTSETYTGNLGGLAGADVKCQTLADAVPLPGEGEYKAWLSDSTGSPSTLFAQSQVPYQLVDGTVIANNWADLVDGILAAPINLTESGEPAPLGLTHCIAATPRTAAWSDTSANGERATINNYDSCDDWRNGVWDGTGTHIGRCTGDTEATTARWSCPLSTVIGCDCRSPLYCFQQ